MPALPDPLSAIKAAAEQAGSLADMARELGYDEPQSQRLYRAARGGTKVIGADLYRDALSVLKDGTAAPPQPVPEPQGVPPPEPRRTLAEWDAGNPGHERRPEPAILFTLDSDDGPTVGWDMNAGAWVPVGAAPGVRLSPALAGALAGPSG